MTEEINPTQQEQAEITPTHQEQAEITSTQQEQAEIRPTFQERFQKVKAAWVAISAQLSEPEQFLDELRAAFPDWTLSHFTDGNEWQAETFTAQDALIVTETGHPLPVGMVRKLFNARRQGLLVVRYVRKTKRIARFYGIYSVEKEGEHQVWLCDRKMGLEQRAKMDAEKAARAARHAEQQARAQANAAAKAEKAAKAAAKAEAKAAKKAAKEQAQVEGAPLPPPPSPAKPKAPENAAGKPAKATPPTPPKEVAKKPVKETPPPVEAESDPAPRRFSVRKLIVPPR